MQHRTVCAVVCTIGSIVFAGCDEFAGESIPQNNATVGSVGTASGSSIESKRASVEVTEIPPEILDYFHRSVIERKRIQRQLRSEVAELKRRRRAANQQAAIDTEISKRESKIAELDGEFPVPPITFTQLHEGKLGGIGRVHVVDVREGSTALVCQSTDRRREHVVILKLLSFVSMTPGEERIFENAFEVTGTEKIPVPRGGERDVFVLKVKRDIQFDPYKALYVKQFPQSGETEPSLTETPTVSKNEPTKSTESPSSTPASKPRNAKSDEEAAASKLKLAKVFVDKGNSTVAKKRLQAIVDDYPETEAGKEAKSLLERLK